MNFISSMTLFVCVFMCNRCHLSFIYQFCCHDLTNKHSKHELDPLNRTIATLSIVFLITKLVRFHDHLKLDSFRSQCAHVLG